MNGWEWGWEGGFLTKVSCCGWISMSNEWQKKWTYGMEWNGKDNATPSDMNVHIHTYIHDAKTAEKQWNGK